MTDKDGHQEPSMEEILASIRRIISEDEMRDAEKEVRVSNEVVAESEHFSSTLTSDGIVTSEKQTEIRQDSKFTQDDELLLTEEDDELLLTEEDDELLLTEEDDEPKLDTIGGRNFQLTNEENRNGLGHSNKVDTVISGRPKIEEVNTVVDQGKNRVGRQEDDKIINSNGLERLEFPSTDQENVLQASLHSDKQTINAANEPIKIGQGRMVDELLQELLQPLLRDWLENNLQQLIAQMVEEEIQKLTKQ